MARSWAISGATSWAAWTIGFLLLAASPAHAAVERVVILKVDGLPADVLERELPRLPNLQRIFEQNGATVDNFYTRGLSLSAPSWSMLDTGRHLEIHGNVEYDRYTLRAYDYLNFLPFYLGYATSRSVDMPGVRLLDELHIPMLLDRFPYEDGFQGLQLLQRGVRWTTFKSVLTRRFAMKPKTLLDEWQTGFSITDSISRQTEHELIEKLKNPRIRYLDYFVGDYDHVAHLTNDRVIQLHALQEIDALAGRLWDAIAASPLASTTALILLSDHGMNTAEGITSQGFSFVDWFTSVAGGAQHVLTNRHPLTEFKVRAAFDPFVSEVITPSKESSYLFGESAQYPTVMLDLDGNERASIGLRNNTFNKLHVLLDQLTRRKLPGPLRTAALNAFIALRAQAAPDWTRDLDRLEEDVLSLEAQIGRQRALVETQPKEWTPAQRDLGLDKDARRQASRIETWKAEHRAYSEYAVTMRRLLALQPSDFDPGRFKIESVIPAKSLGPLNTLADLQNYVVGPAAGGLVLAPGGALDLDRSFRTIDYFAAFDHLAVRNNVQAEVSPRPVDFTAMRIHWQDADHNQDGVWLRRSPLLQALILTRQLGAGPLELRYLPVANLTPAPDGSLHFDHADWAPGFPLELFEDPQLAIPPPQRAAWLSEWHSEREWLEAAHRTRYSNGIVGLVEQVLDLNPAAAQDSRYLNRKRQLRRADLLVFANDHWNFNVRGFNPGGNHGSLLRPSTHSVLMLAGGASTAIPRGAHIAAPYDSLSFLPTVLTLMHRAEPDLPGTPISELVAPTQ